MMPFLARPYLEHSKCILSKCRFNSAFRIRYTLQKCNALELFIIGTETQIMSSIDQIYLKLEIA